MYRTSTIRQHLLIGLVDETSDDLAQPTPQGGTMKALRSTIYMSPSEAKTMFVREDALAAPISDTTTAEVEVPGAFVISEVFEIDASIDMSALAKIAQQKLRVRARREQDQATLYYWDMHALSSRQLNPHRSASTRSRWCCARLPSTRCTRGRSSWRSPRTSR